MTIDTDEMQKFRDLGFIVLRNFFDAKTISTISDRLDTLESKTVLPGEEARYYERSELTGASVLLRVEHIVGDYHPELQELLMGDKPLQCLQQLLGERPVLFKDKVNNKPPGGRADSLHQDQAAGWSTYCDYFLTMVIAVDPNTRENAAMSIMKTGDYRKELMTETWEPLSDDDMADLSADEYEVLELEPGDVVVFDSYIPHGSPANTSNRYRRNIFLTFNRESAGDHREAYYTDKWKSYPPNQAADARSADTFRV